MVKCRSGNALMYISIKRRADKEASRLRTLNRLRDGVRFEEILLAQQLEVTVHVVGIPGVTKCYDSLEGSPLRPCVVSSCRARCKTYAPASVMFPRASSLISVSACSSQNRMSISRYIVVAVVR